MAKDKRETKIELSIADPQPARRRVSAIARFALATALTLACGDREQPDRSRELRADQPTIRVASRTVFADEVLWALGEDVRGRVVALSPMADDPRYSTVATRWPATTPRLGLNPEELLALAPDLVILASFSAPEYRAAVEDKVRVLVLEELDGFDGYLANLAKIGAATGAEAEAAGLRARFEARRDELAAARPPGPQRPTVIAWDYGYVPGAHTSFDDVATVAGFVNLPAREGVEGHQRLDVEQLVVWDPRWIVIGCGERPCAEAEAELGSQPGIGKLAAVGEGRVITIPPPYLATAGEGMLELAARMQARLRERP